MSEAKTSYRRILKNTSIIGGASFLRIVIGLVRTKVLALVLGPTGVGITSLFQGFVTASGTVASMGMQTVGTRQIADAFSRDDPRALYVARRAMFLVSAALAVTAAAAIWLLRGPLAQWVMGSRAYSSAMGWLALGVALTAAAATQSALIQGMCRIADLARVTVYSSAIYAVVGVVLLWWLRTRGLIAYVVVGPLVVFAVGYFYVARLPKSPREHVSWAELTEEWRVLLRLGLAFVGAGLAMPVVQLWIRIDVGKGLGTVGLGQYQAAWMISTQYVAFVLAAMASDYYPRLTGVIRDAPKAVRLVNEQTEIALLLSTPVFVAMMATAPWVVHLLYTAQFAPAVVLLRWQVLGDVLKVASWPLGFVLLAAGDGKTYLWSEWATNLITMLVIAGFLPLIGLPITGVAYLITYAFYLPLMYWLAYRRIGFRWSRSVVRVTLIAFVAAAGAGAIALLFKWGPILGVGISLSLALFAVARISHMSDLGGPAGRLGKFTRQLSGWRHG